MKKISERTDKFYKKFTITKKININVKFCNDKSNIENQSSDCFLFMQKFSLPKYFSLVFEYGVKFKNKCWLYE